MINKSKVEITEEKKYSISEYCKCGNYYENCTCEKCDVFMRFKPLTEIYVEREIDICTDCLHKRSN